MRVSCLVIRHLMSAYCHRYLRSIQGCFKGGTYSFFIKVLVSLMMSFPPLLFAAELRCSNLIQFNDQASSDAKQIVSDQKDWVSEASKSYGRLYDDPRFTKLGHCPDNTLELVKEVSAANQNALKDYNVLILFRFSPFWYSGVTSRVGAELAPQRNTQNLVLTNLREIHSAAYLFHVVLEHKNQSGKKIYDLHYAQNNNGVAIEEYFRNMFLNKDEIEKAIFESSSDPQVSRFKDKLRRYVFQDRAQMLEEMRIRSIPAQEFLSQYHSFLMSELVGNPSSLWLADDVKHPSVSLGDYLKGRGAKTTQLPAHLKWERSVIYLDDSEVTPYVEYPDSVRVYAHPENLSLGETQQVQKAVAITSPFFKYSEKFNRTDRDLAGLQKAFFPPSMLDLNELRGKVVIDMATGGGLAVEEMRAYGVFSYGVEIALSPRQKNMVLHDTSLASPDRTLNVSLSKESGERLFIQADVSSTGIADSQADFLYETYGVFHYLYFGGKSNAGIQKYMIKVINEWKRILKIGGKIRLSPIDESYAQEYKTYFNNFPGLRFVKFEIANPEHDPFRGAIEVERVQ